MLASSLSLPEAILDGVESMSTRSAVSSAKVASRMEVPGRNDRLLMLWLCRSRDSVVMLDE